MPPKIKRRVQDYTTYEMRKIITIKKKQAKDIKIRDIEKINGKILNCTVENDY